MKIKFLHYLLLMLMATLTGAAFAQTSSVAASLDAGTLGFGAHVSVPLRPALNLRLGVSGYHYDFSSSTSDVDYNFRLKLQTIEALLDWYPMDNAFHLSAGLIHNGNKITSVARPSATGTYTINGNTYSAAQAGVVNGNTEFRTAAPYLGIGWGNPVSDKKGWGFTSDLGVMFQGSPSSTLTSSGCTASTQICDQLQNDLAAETTSLDQKTNNFKYYPVLRVGVSYAF